MTSIKNLIASLQDMDPEVAELITAEAYISLSHSNRNQITRLCSFQEVGEYLNYLIPILGQPHQTVEKHYNNPNFENLEICKIRKCYWYSLDKPREWMVEIIGDRPGVIVSNWTAYADMYFPAKWYVDSFKGTDLETWRKRQKRKDDNLKVREVQQKLDR